MNKFNFSKNTIVVLLIITALFTIITVLGVISQNASIRMYGKVVDQSDLPLDANQATNDQAKDKDDTNVTYFIEQDDMGVYMPLYDYSEGMSESDENEILNNFALTYPEYGSPGTGNLIVFGHNTAPYNDYFTPFVSELDVGDIVSITSDEATYKYEITDKQILDKNDTDDIFKTTSTPTITIGTCEIPSEDSQNRIIWSGEII